MSSHREGPLKITLSRQLQQARPHPTHVSGTERSVKTIVTILGTAGLIVAAYVVVISLPDIRRYIKITAM